jgi:hypothetical protein
MMAETTTHAIHPITVIALSSIFAIPAFVSDQPLLKVDQLSAVFFPDLFLTGIFKGGLVFDFLSISFVAVGLHKIRVRN